LCSDEGIVISTRESSEHELNSSASDASQAPQPAQTVEKLLPLGCRFDLLC